jgi:puromycin-sensitive aminopeptidase
MRADRGTVETFLDLTDALAAEPDHDVIDGVAAALGTLDDQVVEPGSEAQVALRSWIARRFGPALNALGWTAAPAEPDEVRLRRAALLRLVGGVAEAPEVLAESRRRLDGYLADRGSLEPNLADSVVALAARVGDAALYERYRTVAADARTPQEQRRFLLNLSSFRSRESIERTLAALLTSEIPTQDVAFLLMRMFGNPRGRDDAWRFLRRRWTAIRKRIPPLMLARLVEATPALRTPRHASEVRSFFHDHPLPEASRALRQALERFRLNAELRRRTAPGVARWLARRKA